MAASIARRRLIASATSIGMAGAAGASMYASMGSRTLHLESEGRSSKLPIYSSPPEPVTLVEVRGPLEDQVAEARKALLNSTASARGFVRGQVDRWIGVEKSIENRVSSLVPHDEALTPNIIYVGIATLAGSIFTRYRSLPIRLVTPPVLLVASMRYLLPATSHNLSQYYLEVEARHLPDQVRAQREQLVQALNSLRKRTGDEAQKIREGSGNLLHKTLQSVEENTGLKVSGTGKGTTAEQIAAGKPRMV